MNADNGEVLDLIERKGPIGFDKLMRKHVSTYSRDGVYTALQELAEEGKVTQDPDRKWRTR